MIKSIPYSKHTYIYTGAFGFPGDVVVQYLSDSAEDIGDAGLILGQEDPLEEEMATHSIILAWKIQWAEETGEL